MKLNIKKYYFFQFFRQLTFFNPVLVVFFLSRGLTIADVTLVQSIHSTGALLLDVPTGAFADKFGNRKSVIVGIFLWALTIFLYGVSFGFIGMALAAFIGGVGQAFMSGANSSFIHETLRSEGKEHEFKKVAGRGSGIGSISASIGMFLGGIVASVSLVATFFASTMTTGIAFVISLLFKEPKAKETNKKPQYTQIIKNGFRAVKSNRTVLWLTIFLASINGIYWTANLFTQPYLKLVNIPLVYFGAIFAGFNLLASLASVVVHRFEFLGQRKGILLMLGVMSASLIVIGALPHAATFTLWATFEIISSISFIVVPAEILKIVDKSHATTVLSFQSLSVRLVNIIASPIIGFVALKFGIFVGLELCGVLLLTVLTVLLFIKPNKELPEVSI